MRRCLWAAVVIAAGASGSGAELRAGAAVGDDSLPKVEKATKLVLARGAKKGPDVVELERLVARAIDLATDGKGTPEGLAAYGFVLDQAHWLGAEKHASLFTEVLDALVESHLDDPALAYVVLRHLMPSAAGDAPTMQDPAHKSPIAGAAGEYFAWIERDSKSAPVQAACAWQRIGGEARAATSIEAAQAVIAKLAGMKEKFGALAGPYGTWGVRYDELIASLQVIGKPAQEIAGKDLDGVAFKLTDYRGKVVLLDFWGYW